MIRDYDILCPFFHSINRTCGIECEGCVPLSVTLTKFKTEQRRTKHMCEYCMTEYTACPVYEMVNQKYEVEV